VQDDERRLSGDQAGGPPGSNGAVRSSQDRYTFANLALVFHDMSATFDALARECDELEGVELARQVLEAENELGNTESNVHETRRELREIARRAMLR